VLELYTPNREAAQEWKEQIAKLKNSSKPPSRLAAEQQRWEETFPRERPWKALS